MFYQVLRSKKKIKQILNKIVNSKMKSFFIFFINNNKFKKTNRKKNTWKSLYNLHTKYLWIENFKMHINRSSLEKIHVVKLEDKRSKVWNEVCCYCRKAWENGGNISVCPNWVTNRFKWNLARSMLQTWH